MSSDLNKMLNNTQKTSADVEKTLKGLIEQYENLYRESNRQFNQERSITGSMSGLEDFYRLIHTIKRNRDLIGSLLRGINNLRPISGFKFIEEDIRPKRAIKKVKPITPVETIEDGVDG